MTKNGRARMKSVGLCGAAFLFSGMMTVACTPASADPPLVGSGGQGAGGSGSAHETGGTTGTGGSIGSNGTGGATETGSGGGGGMPGSGGGSSNGSGGAGQSGGTSGSAGASGSGGAGGIAGTGGAKVGTGGTAAGSGGAGGSAATGCNWVHDTATDSWSFNPAPADKIVLFDGTSLAQWHKLNMPNVTASWMLIGDGSMQVVPSGTGSATQIQTNMKFDNVCVHVEYMTPVFPSTTTDVQKQGNSGVYLKSAYEMQILDTHNSAPLIDGCGAVYKVAAPLVVACNMYLVWNTYEIEFKSSVWDNSNPPKKTKDAVFVQVALNGKLVQKNITLNPAGGSTQAGIPDVAGPQPLGLQDHLDLVRFRNIWATVPRY